MKCQYSVLYTVVHFQNIPPFTSRNISSMLEQLYRCTENSFLRGLVDAKLTLYSIGYWLLCTLHMTSNTRNVSCTPIKTNAEYPWMPTFFISEAINNCVLLISTTKYRQFSVHHCTFPLTNLKVILSNTGMTCNSELNLEIYKCAWYRDATKAK